ncbi:MAG: hypothetical protein ABI585_06000 [Betaproteobacteria bacterium]
MRLASWLATVSDAFVDTTMLRGIAAGSGLPLSMLVAGPVARVQWLVDRAFDGVPRREALGHVPGWRLARTLRRLRATADLVVARVARRSVAPLGFDDDWLPVPDWIGMRLDGPFDLDAIARRNHSAHDDLRRVRRDWRAETSHRADDFVAFYRDMYVPYMRRRYRAGAFLRSARRLRRVFRHGGLLWELHRGERVAGLLFVVRRGTLDAVALGVSNGDEALLRAGAVVALYVHMIEFARTSGCHAIDWHGSRPSLADGVTQVKRKWGGTVYDRPQVLHTTLVRWDRMSPAVLAFLARTPLVFHDVDGLSALAVADGNDAAANAKASARLRTPGLRRLVLLASSMPAAERAGGPVLPLHISAVDGGPRLLRAAMREALRVDADG